MSWSQEDKQVVEIWDKQVRKVDGHFELPIPWKSDVHMPNNVSMARSRLDSLRQSLYRKGLFSQYDEEVQKLLLEGYAECVPVNEIDKSEGVWYLPHQAVISPSKPGKFRVVFDCAAKFEGESLNDKCLQGPDLNNKLLSVLLRFRQYPCAVMSDIQAMYYQVLIPSEDRDALRFLWFDRNGEVVHLRMTRHVFGGIWCSASSTYALRLVASESEPDPRVVDTIQRSFYVDDCLKSFISTDEAISVVQGTKSLLETGGFKLTKFVSNDSGVLAAIPLEDQAKEVKDLSLDVRSKALGIRWNVSDDHFYFDAKVADVPKVTRRHILSVVSSTFDPLGFLSPVVLIGRLIFQEATRLKLGWDEVVPVELQNRWDSWLQDLMSLSMIRIPRCLVRGDPSDMVFELHTFCDASARAYGCCSYLRSVDNLGCVSSVLMLAKSRVAPIKSVTIPRLELQAAVMGAQVNAMIKRDVDLEIAESYFWTDSEIVLKYLHNASRRFQVYVSNRVSKILQSSEVHQWRHVPGKINPADVVSRGGDLRELDKDIWYKGPEFLRAPKSEWPVSSCDLSVSDDDPEVKIPKVCHVVDVCPSSHPIEQLSSHFSDWYQLKRAVAWWLRLQDRLRHKPRVVSTRLTTEDLARAQLAIVKHVQERYFKKEISALVAGRPFSKSSSIRPLDPILDEDGVLRVGGRLRHSGLPNSSKHPYLIPFQHQIAHLIVREVHDRAHLGSEWVVSDVRKTFWVTKIRRIAKQVSHQCVTCKRLFAKAKPQKMADHIPERLEEGHVPFTYTGLDCFRPFIVKQGRSDVKRYGCVFTCLNTRAVHIEKLDGLDTDSFLNGFRRFIARRGIPAKVWSDNGTNFVGGKAELARSDQNRDRSVSLDREVFHERGVSIDSDAIHAYAVKFNVQWHFNPPGASHMGGLWERMIRTIRKVFAGIAHSNVRWTDDVLHTLFCEAESIINGRPITKTSEDVNDLSALTPNHLLLLRETLSRAPGEFGQVDLYKRRWRCVQHLAEVFWRRWVREYLPELQKRDKWCKRRSNLKVGDLVLIMDENTPRGVWPMGIVCGVNHSRDGLVRSVKVRTKATVLVRPVTKVVGLEGCEQ